MKSILAGTFRAISARRTIAVLLAGVVCVGLFTRQSMAGLWTLVDENSSVEIDTESSAGVYSWNVDGVEQLEKQWFWYRVGDTPEQSIDVLSLVIEGATDTDFDNDLDTLYVRYEGVDFEVEIRYSLDGALEGSGASDLAEQITITNTSDHAAVDFHFFQYCDFELLGTADGDSVAFTNVNAVAQLDGGFGLTETVVTPAPDHREAAVFNTTLAKLTDGNADDLSDTPAYGVVLGPGDVTWAYQWDVELSPGQSFQISKDKNLVAIPEPTAVLLLAVGGLLLATRGRRIASR